MLKLDPKKYPILAGDMVELYGQDDADHKAQAAEPGEHDDQFVDPTAYLKPFELTPEREAMLDEFGLMGDIEQDGEEDGMKMAKLRQSVAEDLARTEKLFKSHEVADSRIEGLEEAIAAKVKEIGKEVAPEFDFDVEVQAQESNLGNPSYWYTVTLRKGDQEKELDIFHYTYEPGVSLSDSASSWKWAAWLGLSESPFYDEDFVDAYDYDQMTIAMEQSLATINESQDLWDIKDAVKSLSESYVPTYHYVVDLDERGIFKAHVEDGNGNSVWEASSEEEGHDGAFWPVEDGFMRHSTDVDGLERYLKQMGTIPKNADLVLGGN